MAKDENKKTGTELENQGGTSATQTPAPEEGKEGKDNKKGKTKETVEIEKSTLDKLLKGIEDLKASNKKRDEEIEMLKSISDKGRLARYEGENKAELIPTAKIAFWEGLPVLGWTKIKDEVGFRNGQLVVNQQIRVFLQEEGAAEPKTADLDYLYWVQNTQCISGEVIERSARKEGNFWTVAFKDGRKVTVDIRFINAF